MNPIKKIIIILIAIFSISISNIEARRIYNKQSGESDLLTQEQTDKAYWRKVSNPISGLTSMLAGSVSDASNPASLRSLWSQSVTLRRIKDIDCWQFNTKIGKVILTDYKWENHIQIRHPFVTTEAIRKALEHPRVMYKSNKRWIFEKDNLRVVVGNDKVITAYYMDGRQYEQRPAGDIRNSNAVCK